MAATPGSLLPSLATGATTTPSLPRPVEEEQEHLATGEQEEEFLSEQQQVSTELLHMPCVLPGPPRPPRGTWPRRMLP